MRRDEKSGEVMGCPRKSGVGMGRREKGSMASQPVSENTHFIPIVDGFP